MIDWLDAFWYWLFGTPHDLRAVCGVARSPHWPAVRKFWLTANPTCAACGGTDCVEAHHKRPFHLHPELELSRSNLVTLCQHPSRTCHFHFGHCATSWSDFNPHVVEDAATFLSRIADAKRRRNTGNVAPLPTCLNPPPGTF